MKLKTIVTYPMDENTYVLYGEKDHECIVIDPGDYESVQEFLQQENLNCTHILLTRGHFDHIGGVADLQANYGAKVCIHMLDADMLSDSEKSLSATMPGYTKPSKADILVQDGDVIQAAGFELFVIGTPGHTQGGVCYLDEEHHLLFTGDTLFFMSVGRTDFPGGNADQLFESITQQLFTLMGEYRVLPGHMRESSLNFERERNPYVKQFTEE